MARLAESGGYNSLWVWDHLLLGSRKVYPVLDSLTTLAAIGARTSKVKLGTGVLILSLRNPVVVSKVLSTIHYVTRGRLILGAAAGWYEREFRATGTDFSKRGKMFEERFELVRRLLTENDVNYSSGGFDLKHASMEPRFSEKVPMLVGGYSDRVLERAGRIGDGWISYYYTPESFAESWEKVRKSSVENNRDPDTLLRVNIVPLAIASDYEEGKKIAEDFTARYMDLPKGTGCTVDSAIKGTPAECIEQIRKFESAGVQELVFIPSNYDPGYVEKMASEILPLLPSK